MLVSKPVLVVSGKKIPTPARSPPQHCFGGGGGEAGTEFCKGLNVSVPKKAEFASTTGGTCAYWRYMYKVPVVATVNHSTKNRPPLKCQGEVTSLNFDVFFCEHFFLTFF